MVRSPLLRALIYAPAKLYEFGVRARSALYEQGLLKVNRLKAPVISVGNITVGGTGKTPCVAFLANMLTQSGLQVAILSRGYQRLSEGRVEVSNGRKILAGPEAAGDEPYLLAKLCPGVRVVVDQDRSGAGKWLEEQGAISAFILDDGFQHLRLARDLNLLLIDASEPLDETEVVPLGRLRESLQGIRRANAVIVTRADQNFDRAALEQTIKRFTQHQTPIFYATHRMTRLRRLDRQESIDVLAFAGEPIAAVSGIARPERLIADLTKLGMQIAMRRDFRDHHRYTSEELRDIQDAARSAGARALITTEKDAANLPAEFVNLISMPIYAAQIEFLCEDEPALKKLVLSVASMNRL
jgi:tetraacyldisaccharide 4'-kinase